MITKHLCKNGVRIIHEFIPHVRSVSFGIWVQAGSNDELQEEAGLAHFIEHMLFKGTITETAKSIAEQFDRMGGELNAFTSKEATCFHATVLTEDAKQALALLGDMLFNSTFKEQEIAKEKSVILEEIAMCEDAPDDEVHEQLWKIMYPNHPLGKPVLGTKASIMRFTKASIQRFMTRLYRPERTVISLVGKYDEQLIDFIERLFSRFEVSVKSKSQPSILTPTFQSGTLIHKKEIEQAHLCLGYPGLPLQDPRQYELAVLDTIVGGSMSSRLFQEVREERGLAYAIYSYTSSYESAGTFVIYGGTSPRNLDKLEATILTVLRKMIEQGLGEEEFIHAKQSVKSGFLLGLESIESRMTRNGHQELLHRKHRTVDEVIQKINQVEKGSVEKMAIDIFSQPYAKAVIKPKIK